MHVVQKLDGIITRWYDHMNANFVKAKYSAFVTSHTNNASLPTLHRVAYMTCKSCVCVCVRACVRACVHACVRACVCVFFMVFYRIHCGIIKNVDLLLKT